MDQTLDRTALHDLHMELGARMVPFAGYAMPVQYPMGVLREHLHCRAAAGLFDVGHMGQVILRPRSGDVDDAARSLERLVPAAILGLAEGRQRYAVLMNDAGGIRDDLMIARRADHMFSVVNAACKVADVAHFRAGLPDCDVEVVDRGLLALQGPGAEAALAALGLRVSAMRFMDVGSFDWDGADLWISRSGYTGEDGFEISVPQSHAQALARALLAQPGVAPIGLGARDSLRLEAGLCLYGADLDATTTPVEANLRWSIQKSRRPEGVRAGGYPGADIVARQLADGPPRLRVGLLPQGRAPMRAGTMLFAGDAQVGAITSGGFGPSLEMPIAMGYVSRDHAATGTVLMAELRGKRSPVTVADLPFRPATFKR